MADTVCAPQMRNNVEFQKLLAVAIAGLLAGCNDPDSDVRIAADESLNRTITTLIDTHLGRLQVELYVTHVTHVPVALHLRLPASRRAMVASFGHAWAAEAHSTALRGTALRDCAVGLVRIMSASLVMRVLPGCPHRL